MSNRMKRYETQMERYFKGTKTVFIVSHTLGLIEQHSTRALFLMDGKIQADGDQKDVIAEYKKTV